MQIGGILLDYYDPSPRSEEVVIQSDGTVSPFTAPIKTTDFATYWLEESLSVPLILQRSNAILDGGNNTVPLLELYRVQNSTVKFFEVGELTVDCADCFIYRIRAAQVRAVCTKTIFEGLHVEGKCLELSGMKNKVCRSNIKNLEYVHFHFLEDSLICENNITRCEIGIELYASWGNRIERNYISNCCVGVELFGATVSGNEIVKNTFSNCTTAVSCVDSEGNFITENKIVGGSRILALAEEMSPPPSAIYLHGVFTGTVSKNLIVAYPRGLTLSYSDRVTVSTNTIMKCNEGIYVGGSNSCTLFENNLLDNACDVYLECSYNITLYHNNFLDAKGVLVDGCATFRPSTCTFDLGYPHGGNYWKDYVGVDEKSGVNQDQPGSDGIGDKPYIISDQVADRYPLMEPSGELPQLTNDYAVQGGYVIQLTSNSIISNFKYTPENHTISFQVEWRKGSKGFAEIRIPKSIESGQPEVLFDGKPIPFNKSESEDFINVNFTYEHSRHEVVICFKQEETLFEQGYLYIIMVCGAASMLLFSIAILVRKRRAGKVIRNSFKH